MGPSARKAAKIGMHLGDQSQVGKSESGSSRQNILPQHQAQTEETSDIKPSTPGLEAAMDCLFGGLVLPSLKCAGERRWCPCAQRFCARTLFSAAYGFAKPSGAPKERGMPKRTQAITGGK
jgi:hypothetical protein